MFIVDLFGLFVFGFVVVFVSVFVCVCWLLCYVVMYDFMVFVWYWIVFGLFVLLVGYSGWLNWV